MNKGEVLYPEDKKPSFFYGYIVVLAGFLVFLVAWGIAMAFGVFFKPLLAEFGWSRAMLSGAYTLSSIVVGVTGIVTGRLTDKLGPRLVVTVGGFLLGLGFLLLSYITALWQFYILYGLVIGIGLGTTVIPIMSTTSRWFIKKRGLITGITQAGAGLGGVVIPPPVGWLILTHGWRISYTIVGIIALVVIILAAQFLKRDPTQMGLVPYGEGKVEVETSDLQDRGFSLQEAIHARQFWMLCVLFFCFGFTRSTIVTHITPYTTDLGFSLIVGANVLAIICGASIVGRLIFGRIADGIGDRQTLIISFILMAIILFWVTAAKELWMLCLFAVIFGLAWGSLAVLRISITSEVFGLSSLGVILGIIEMGAQVGGSGGPFLAGWIFDIAGSYFLAFLVSAGVAILGFILSWLLTPIGNKEAMGEASG